VSLAGRTVSEASSVASGVGLLLQGWMTQRSAVAGLKSLPIYELDEDGTIGLDKSSFVLSR